MTYSEIDLLFSEASKVMHLDKSHDAIRLKLQDHISAQHRKDNASSDSASYYNTPYVRDVFGSETDGHVVHSKDGKLTMSKYKADGKNGYILSNHKAVKNAYVADEKNANESFFMLLDGKELQVSEASTTNEFCEVLDLQEADAKAATAKVTLIRAGKGSSGFYTEAALKQAVKDGLFENTQMFLNHQTKEERLARPEGDVTKLVGKLSGIKFVESDGKNPARIVGTAKVYPEFSPFIASRKDDIGLSVRVGAENSGKVQEGVPLVEKMVYGLSVDYVTKAGAGGKIEELYESFKGNSGKQTDSGNSPQGDVSMTDEEKGLLKALQESVAGLTAKLDRVTEQNVSLQASILVDESLATSGLSARGKARVKSVVLANVPVTAAGGNIDTAKLQEAVKAAVTEEKAYLQESGVVTRTAPVVNFLGGGIKLVDESGKDKSDEAILEEADKATNSALALIMGKEKSA